MKRLLRISTWALLTLFSFQVSAQSAIKMGNHAGDSSTAPGTIYLGDYAGQYSKASGSLMFGHFTGQQNRTGAGLSLFGNGVLSKARIAYWISAFGDGAAGNHYAGDFGSYFGAGSGEFDSLGVANSNFGYKTGHFNTTGRYNFNGGIYAGWYNKGGSWNVKLGSGAMAYNEDGFFSAVVGADNSAYSSGSRFASVGAFSLLGAYTGDGYYALGFEAGRNANGTGFSGYLGYQADALTPNVFNSLAVGAWTVIRNPNEIVIGNSSITSITVPVPISVVSDARYKLDIKSSTIGLKFLKEIDIKRYRLNIPKLNHYNKRDSLDTIPAMAEAIKEAGEIFYDGVLAQDVAAVAKRQGISFSGVKIPKNDSGILTVDYTAFIMPLINATKELAAQNEDLQRQINELKKQLAQKNTVNAVVTTASLEQNTPNPVTNRTSVRYCVPDGTKGQILVVDAAGKQLQRLNVSGSGVVNLDTSLLPAGTYGYSLVVDGRTVETKRMVVVKR